MKTNKLLLFLTISIVVFLYSCNQSKEYVEFEKVHENDVDTLKHESFDFRIGKGETWKMWDKIFNACMKSEVLDNPHYFGMSNTIGLGSITDKKYESVIKIIDKSIFTQKEINSLIKLGTPTSCEYSQKLTMSLNVFLNSQFSVTSPGSGDITAELNLAISTAKDTSVKVDGWQKDELITGVLRDILNETTDSKKLKFKEDLFTSGNLILVRVVKINGFSSEIITRNEISTKLEAKLKSGVIASVGNTGAKASFEYVNKTTIRVKSAGEFYIFGKYMKAKKVNVKPK